MSNHPGGRVGSSRRRTAAGWLFLILALAVPVSLGAGGRELPSPKDKWIEVRTANFTLFSDAPEKRVSGIGGRLEVLRYALSRVYKTFEVNSPVPTWIHVFKDEDSFAPYKSGYTGSGISPAGYFMPRGEANYVALNGSSEADPFAIVFHEYVHYVLNNNLPRIPSWFEEGLAECYSTFRVIGGQAELGRPPQARLASIRNYSPMPLEEFLNTYPGAKGHAEGRPGLYYAQSWALTHYLLWGNPQRRPQLSFYLERLEQGRHEKDAFEASFQTTYAKLEGELRNYVRGGRFVFSLLKLDEADIDTGARVVSMKREDVLYRLGTLRLRQDPAQTAAVQKYFEEALRVSPSHAPSHAGLGMVQDAERRFDQAAPHYEKALELAPDDTTINFLHGQSLLAWIESEERAPGTVTGGTAPELLRARERFGKSIAMNPLFAEAYVGFGRTFVLGAESPGPAITVLERARQLLPSRADVVANLALVHARRGDREQVRDLILNDFGRRNAPDALEIVRAGLARIAPPAVDGAAPQDAFTLETIIASADDLEIRGRLENQLRLARAVVAAREQWATFTRAQQRAGREDYQEAIALLESLPPSIYDPNLAARVKALLERLRKEAGKKPRGGA